MKLINEKVVKYWEVAAVVAILTSLVLFILSLTMHFSEHTHHMLEMVEIIVICVFLGEVTVQLIYADDKMAYLKKNWFYILTILPLAGIFRMLRLGQTAQLVRVGELLGKLGASEGAALKLFAFATPAKLMFAKECGFLAYHLAHTNFKNVPKDLDITTLNRYSSPRVPKHVAQSISDGARYYLERNHKKRIITKDHKYMEVFKAEQQLHSAHDHEALDLASYYKEIGVKTKGLIVTDEKITHGHHQIHSYAKGHSIIVSTKDIMTKHDYPQIPSKKMQQLRSFVIGYNALAKSNMPCYNSSCSHSHLTQKELDMQAFMLYMHGKLPLCHDHTHN